MSRPLRKIAGLFAIAMIPVAGLSGYACYTAYHGQKGDHERHVFLKKESAGAAFGVDSSLPRHEPDVTVGLLPLSQRDFGLLGATWRETLAFDYRENGPTLRKQTCASYNRKSADGGFPAQCYMIVYTTPGQGKQVIMPVINPIIALTDITITPSAEEAKRVKAKVLWAKCAFNEVLHDCSLQQPTPIAMSEDYYGRLKRLITLVRDGRPNTPSQGQKNAAPSP